MQALFQPENGETEMKAKFYSRIADSQAVNGGKMECRGAEKRGIGKQVFWEP
jgi:hypothetical protein